MSHCLVVVLLRTAWTLMSPRRMFHPSGPKLVFRPTRTSSFSTLHCLCVVLLRRLSAAWCPSHVRCLPPIGLILRVAAHHHPLQRGLIAINSLCSKRKTVLLVFLLLG